MTRRRGWRWVALAIAAVVALAAIDLVRPLPAGWFAPIDSRRVLARDGSPLAVRPVPDRGRERWVELDQVSPHVIDALIAAEDHRFRAHHGVDARAIARALRVAARDGALTQGGSTLTQQTARLLAGRPPGIPGKLVEAWRALKLERHLDKDQILTWYLNRVYFGRGDYGIEAAARSVFDESASSLSLAESAMLVGILPAPERLHPELDPAAALRARAHVLDRMVAVGVATPDDAERAATEPIQRRRRAAEGLAPHLVARMLDADPDAAAIPTTIDPTLQRDVETLVGRQLAALAGLEVDHAAVIVVDLATSDVLAYVGSGGFGRPDGQVDAVRALRSPGSALKPFVYALAFSAGVRPGEVVYDLPDRYPTRRGSWAPENYSRTFRGPLRVREALATSANLPAVRMLDRVGPSTLHSRLQAIGLGLPEPTSHYGLGLALGDAEVTLEDLTAAYAAIGRGGAWQPLRYRRDDPRSDGLRVLDPGVAGVVADVLADPVARSPAFGRYGPLERPYWAAVKTGTSTGYRDNWTVGFTRDVAVGVWVGNFDGRAMGDVSGVTGAGPLWAAVLDRATELRSGGRSPAPPDPPGWERRDSCALSGGAPGPRCPHVVSDWARIGSPPAAPCGWHRAGPDGATCVDWPPELVPWAADHGLITPCGGDVAPGEVPRDPDPAVAITYPPPGTIVYVDPRIPADHQQVPLRAAVAVDAGLVEWIVDGARIATAEPGAVTLWRPPSTGAHEIAVAVDGRRRDTVTIEVRGHP